MPFLLAGALLLLIFVQPGAQPAAQSGAHAGAKSAAAAAANPPASQSPVAPGIHPATGAKVYTLHPGLKIDPKAGELYVESKVCLDSGILEFLLVRGDTKAYESALSTEASPSQVMAGMLLLQWKPGDPLSILALRGRDTLPLASLLRARNPKEALPDFRWRLKGSNHEEVEQRKAGFWADQEGIHVALVERSEAVVQLEGDLRNPYHASGFGYEIRPGAAGKVGQPITLIFKKGRRG